MLNKRTIIQGFTALVFAVGLVFSPLHIAGVVFSAPFAEEVTPPPDSPADLPVEPSMEEPLIPETIETSPDAPLPKETNAPNAESTSEPDGTQPVEPIDTTPEPQATLPLDDPAVTPEHAQPTALSSTQVDPVDESAALPAETAADEPKIEVNSPQESESQSPQWVSGQAILRFDPTIPLEQQIAKLTSLGLEVTASIPALGILTVAVPAGQELEAASTLALMEGVQYAEPVYLASALDTTPNDPAFPSQGDMVAINAPGGWDYFTGSSSVIIAIIDSGVDMTHPEFAGRLLPGYDFVNNDNDAQDDYGHGTHVAGIAAATGDNSTGIAGLDWSAKILPVKVLNSSGFGSALSVSQGIIFAVDNGAKIINLSLGFVSNTAAVQAAVEYAYLHGVTVIASAGNSNGAITYPAALPHVIAVGAVDNTGNRWASSNYGPQMDVVAPGVNIYSTIPSGYTTSTGTSMAAPHVAGLAALLEGMYPLTPDQVKTSISSTSRDLGSAGWDTYFGYGLIQVRDALFRLWQKLLPRNHGESTEAAPTAVVYPTFTPTPTITPTPIFVQ